MEDTKQFVKIDVAGKDEMSWQHYRYKFMSYINKILDSVIDHENNSTIRDEGKAFTSKVLDYAKQKLDKPRHDNAKTIAEIDLLYSQREKELAETRKINAEADKIEFENKIKKIRFALIGIKAMARFNEDEEIIVFVKEVEVFIESINAIESSKGEL